MQSRSREGAWIEILLERSSGSTSPVAPARERGLKSQWMMVLMLSRCRSREGAWIEIRLRRQRKRLDQSLPRGSVD